MLTINHGLGCDGMRVRDSGDDIHRKPYCKMWKNGNSTVFSSVAEPKLFIPAPAPSLSFISAPAPAPATAK